PNRLRAMYEVRAIGDYFVAVGMSRQVFRRHMGHPPWERFDDGVLITNKKKFEIGGFISVDGFGMDEIYAVGHRGEIWMFDGKKWRQIDSPTNLILNCVRCMPSGEVFIGGDGGVMLRGRRNAWKKIKQDVTEEALTSLAGFQDRVYFCTEGGTILALDGNSVEKVKIKKDM